jgi:hypothetical protein
MQQQTDCGIEQILARAILDLELVSLSLIEENNI